MLQVYLLEVWTAASGRVLTLKSKLHLIMCNQSVCCVNRAYKELLPNNVNIIGLELIFAYKYI